MSFVCVRVCVLKKDDISIDWSSWSVVGSIALSKLWLEYGLSSSQIRTNNVRNVVLLVVDPSSIHHYIFGLTNTITVFTWWWKSSDMEIPMSCCWAHQQHFVSPMIHVEHQPSVENFVSNAFVFRSWSLCLDGRSDFLEFMCIWCKLPPWIWERFVLFPLESSQISHAYVRSILWFGRLITSTPYVFLAHQATDWSVQG